jgi:hypothetical protein
MAAAPCKYQTRGSGGDGHDDDDDDDDGVMMIGESRGITEGGKGVYEITQKVTERSEILVISVGMRT